MVKFRMATRTTDVEDMSHFLSMEIFSKMEKKTEGQSDAAAAFTALLYVDLLKYKARLQEEMAPPCLFCSKKGRTIKMKLYQTSEDEAVYLCPTKNCLYPYLGRDNGLPVFQVRKRRIEDMPCHSLAFPSSHSAQEPEEGRLPPRKSPSSTLKTPHPVQEEGRISPEKPKISKHSKVAEVETGDDDVVLDSSVKVIPDSSFEKETFTAVDTETHPTALDLTADSAEIFSGTEENVTEAPISAQNLDTAQSSRPLEDQQQPSCSQQESSHVSNVQKPPNGEGIEEGEASRKSGPLAQSVPAEPSSIRTTKKNVLEELLEGMDYPEDSVEKDGQGPRKRNDSIDSVDVEKDLLREMGCVIPEKNVPAQCATPELARTVTDIAKGISPCDVDDVLNQLSQSSTTESVPTQTYPPAELVSPVLEVSTVQEESGIVVSADVGESVNKTGTDGQVNAGRISHCSPRSTRSSGSNKVDPETVLEKRKREEILKSMKATRTKGNRPKVKPAFSSDRRNLIAALKLSLEQQQSEADNRKEIDQLKSPNTRSALQSSVLQRNLEKKKRQKEHPPPVLRTDIIHPVAKIPKISGPGMISKLVEDQVTASNSSTGFAGYLARSTAPSAVAEAGRGTPSPSGSGSSPGAAVPSRNDERIRKILQEHKRNQRARSAANLPGLQNTQQKFAGFGMTQSATQPNLNSVAQTSFSPITQIRSPLSMQPENSGAMESYLMDPYQPMLPPNSSGIAVGNHQPSSFPVATTTDATHIPVPGQGMTNLSDANAFYHGGFGQESSAFNGYGLRESFGVFTGYTSAASQLEQEGRTVNGVGYDEMEGFDYFDLN